MQQITSRIQEEARRLLSEDVVDMVIGYEEGWDPSTTTPCVVRGEAQVSRLVFDERCVYNLARYLVGREGYLTSRFTSAKDRPRVALVARPATLRAVSVLIQENQFGREDLLILGIVDGTAVGIEPDVEVGQIGPDDARRQETRARIRELEQMSSAERWAFWREEFSRCIRCYACRQVCPFCYCEECIAEENRPQWIGRSPLPRNNTSWNAIRAFHLVGRCVDCGECERVCPVDIPLSLINVKMVEEVAAVFDYVAGADIEAAPALATFQVDDTNDFIR
jgi:formate dehydrogenase subunit beta